MSDPKPARKEPRPKVRDPVVFHDSSGVPHDAMVTAAWDQDTLTDQPMINCVFVSSDESMINCVFVSSDESKQDGYGRQIERATSCSHGGTNGACHGYYWRWPGEQPNPPRNPSSV